MTSKMQPLSGELEVLAERLKSTTEEATSRSRQPPPADAAGNSSWSEPGAKVSFRSLPPEDRAALLEQVNQAMLKRFASRWTRTMGGESLDQWGQSFVRMGMTVDEIKRAVAASLPWAIAENNGWPPDCVAAFIMLVRKPTAESAFHRRLRQADEARRLSAPVKATEPGMARAHLQAIRAKLRGGRR